ncbi:hypothetical protein CUN85_07540 [Methanolobus halotolerans]|uniref:SCP-2 sterol transfer family protein n=1 Tax=Methanolobus halotolerans TaxID=2052935 RepID=A0A4E0PVN9_9EURY|nr:hypothetical protein CUN85_07540 [Methanolobus halotolerans]
MLSAPALAVNGNTTNETNETNNNLYEELNQSVVRYNDGISDVPQLVITVAGNEVILIDIDMEDGSNLMIEAVTNNGMITSFDEVSSAGEVEPTMVIETDEETARTIIDSDTPLRTSMNAIDQGDADVDVSGFIKNAALRALRVLY